MALFQFACPHCSGQFQVQDPPAGQAIACPHCGLGVALPSELPPPADAVETPPESPRSTDGIELPFELDEPAPAMPPSPLAGAPVVLPQTRAPMSREDRERRRTIRNLVLMVTGLIVLVAAVLVLSRV